MEKKIVVSYVYDCVSWYDYEALGKMVGGYSRKDIPYELLGILTLDHVNQSLSDEGPWYSCRSGCIRHLYYLKYVDTDTVKTSTKLYKTNLLSDMIFTKADAYTSDENV